MTNIPDSTDLAAIAYEARIEISVAETVEAADVVPGDAAHVFDAAEIGYYEAELRSLRDAATALDDAEHLRE